MHPLDNPAWSALTTHQSQVALVEGMARRFPPEMAVHGALALPIPQAWDSLRRLAGVPVGLFSATPLVLPPGWSVIRHFELLEMVCEDGCAAPAGNGGPKIVELSEADLPEMSELYAGRWPERTLCQRILKLGPFLGIRSEGQLVAMAGLRMHLPGYREITKVGTLAGHESRGYATAIVAALVDRIRERNERPFLNVRTDNSRAVSIYRRLGFRERTRLHSTAVVYGATSA